MEITQNSFVIGLDSSTQSTKAIAWRGDGVAMAEGRAPIAMANPQVGWFEQDPEDWWQSCLLALGDLGTKIDLAGAQGLAISNQRETICFLGEDYRASQPAIVWLDERARRQMKTVSKALGAGNIHRISGKPVDITPVLYRLAWLKQNDPDTFAATACFADVQAYLVHRLTGQMKTGWISSDPMGCFDVVEKRWSGEILDYLGLEPQRFPESHRPGTQLGSVTEDGSAATGLATGLPVFAAGGDGQCAGLGTNCTMPGRAYINLGTAVVSGVWSRDYIYNSSWRTEISATGTGYINEMCLRSGAFLINWFVDNFTEGQKNNPGIFAELEAEAALIPIGSEGLLTLPYWAGCMNPHWDSEARGVFIGLTGSHTPAHIYRSILEGITLDVAQGTQAMVEAGIDIDEFIAIGGGAQSALWCQMLADATARPVRVCDTVEASALGAGMIAAFGAGHFATIEDAAAAMSGSHATVHPNARAHARYADLLEIYKPVYHNNAASFAELVAFAGQER
ncbi:Xylulose kinase [hydrothermal vent metagenome]|uniref:Xylulose kinase n=1 Tax=hydrothermal vent metagenome TaxID=652676 RepID=A0A3B0TD61_9ZZZZ